PVLKFRLGSTTINWPFLSSHLTVTSIPSACLVTNNSRALSLTGACDEPGSGVRRPQRTARMNCLIRILILLTFCPRFCLLSLNVFQPDLQHGHFARIQSGGVGRVRPHPFAF